MAIKLILSIVISLVLLMVVKTTYYTLSFLTFYIKYNVLGLEYKPSGEARHYYKVVSPEEMYAKEANEI